jgi:hypothetical protein
MKRRYACCSGGRSPSVEARAAWCSQYRFADFLFAYGARRRGGQLVADK